MRRSKQKNIERYEIDRSPLAQRPTQRDVALLLKETKDDLRRLATYKEEFIVRRQTTSKNGKVRDLAYPVGRLRAAHERLKFHLNKVKQPDYLFSPRKKKGQRDNAAHHLDQDQYLTLDLKQFYPSTSDLMVRRWFRDYLGMYDDVAGLLTRLCTIDGKVSFGSPLTPVLCTMIHRPMFDQIAKVCDWRNLRYSVWVDDLTISGKFVPREALHEIREIVRVHGFKTHRIKYRTGNRPVFITGIGVVGALLVAPRSLNQKIKELWVDYHDSVTDEERESLTLKLLSQLGTVRHIAGPNSKVGQKAANQMNSLRQKLNKMQQAAEKKQTEDRLLQSTLKNVNSSAEVPWL
ncbi:reverse transcriptase family protein [[Pseudomonas] carboxydohydrogena]|uniref:Reverse transcriptase family protein n=1 Tax=Afipia carboxydohydrogena TaxID=290 RepID=A0ABY8BV54_AFICR|nr:reverse transcriptase family protein [[Pseudomonas] carboxydohydrogena]WEF52739.1 reverse transcriptase family protein [[Pseudomonas] carboxydohydrogena]